MFFIEIKSPISKCFRMYHYEELAEEDQVGIMQVFRNINFMWELKN